MSALKELYAKAVLDKDDHDNNSRILRELVRLGYAETNSFADTDYYAIKDRASGQYLATWTHSIFPRDIRYTTGVMNNRVDRVVNLSFVTECKRANLSLYRSEKMEVFKNLLRLERDNYEIADGYDLKEFEIVCITQRYLERHTVANYKEVLQAPSSIE